MSKSLQDWLKGKLDGMVSIQFCVVGRPEADVIAFAWSGKQLRIHILTQPVRTRTLRRMLQSASDIGINTMFIVDSRLLPNDNERMEPRDWMLALHELTYERVYTYKIVDQRAGIYPVHLEEIPGTKHMKVLFGPRVEFETIRFYRRSVNNPRSVRGDWMTADFGNSAFWRNMDFRFYQSNNGGRHDRFQASDYRETWNSGQASRQAGHASQRVTRPVQSQLDACYQILGIDKNTTQEEAKRAFRKRAIAVHPDTSNLPTEQAAKQFQILTDAYDYLREIKGWN